MSTSDSVALRVQRLEKKDQVAVLVRLAEARSASGRIGPGDVAELFDAFGLPAPAKVSNYFGVLEKAGLMARGVDRRWRLTPRGRAYAEAITTDMDLAVLQLEASATSAPTLAGAVHPVVPPSLAPPDLIPSLRSFLDQFPFERNVFGMTRFPGRTTAGELDPISLALDETRSACAAHGLVFHLASDRQIVDDLWPNVAAHLWGSKYGVAFYEDLTGRGLNYNLNIEVGSCLVLGRRLAILKDPGVPKLPTDLVGKIFKEVEFSDPTAFGGVVHTWIRDDLALGACASCP